MWLERFAERVANKVAKRARRALLQIPFYRRKLRDNNIPLNEVKGINCIAKLDRFLNKYRVVQWITEKELIEMSDRYSSDLSLVSEKERIWVQASSGYTLSARMLLDGARNLPITRKRVAYTRKDLKVACRIFEGLKDILKNDASPIAIFGRLGDLCGSGTYPFLAISGNYTKLNVKTLYYGIPLSETEAYQWLRECESLKISGLIGIPSTLEKLVEIAERNNLFFDNLKLVGTGGHSLPKKLVEKLCRIGAKLITIGYGAQEIAPLANVAVGNIYSEMSSFPQTDGMGVLGNLYYLRITDENGESVSDGESGFIRVTSPFEGTTLLDYNTYDVGKFIERKHTITYKGKFITLPFPVLGYDVYRSQENALRVLEKNVYTKDIIELCYPYVGYNFIAAAQDNNLFIFICDSKKKNDIEDKLANLLPSDVFKNTHIKVIPKQLLEKYLHPKGHYKPHNIVTADVFHQLKREANL